MTDIDVITDEHAPVVPVVSDAPVKQLKVKRLSLIHISEPTRPY